MRTKNKSKRQHKQSGPDTKPRSQKKALSSAKTQKKAGPPAAVLDSEKLKSLYATMLKCRLLGAQERESSHAQEFSGGAQSFTGREAMLVGAASHALPEDRVIASNASIQQLAAQLFFSSAGPASTSEPTVEPALARGMTLAHELKGQRKTVIIFCGVNIAAADIDHALSQAARQKLPLVCVAEANLSAIDAEQTRQRDHHPAQHDMKSFFPRIAVDGTDVVAVFRVAQEAVRRARGGHGPSLIQCVMPETNMRNEENDPLTFMERYLRRRKLWTVK